MTTKPYRSITNGDIFDIGQTVNGRSEFIYLDDKWYYYEADKKRHCDFRPYEYDNDDLTDMIIEDDLMGYDDVQLLGNLFN